MREKKEINIEIGKRIKTAREAAKMTQEALSEALDMGVKHISAIECGAAGISVATLKKICSVLSVSANSLLFGEAEHSDEALILADRLSHLSADEFSLAEDVLNKMLLYFASHKSE